MSVVLDEVNNLFSWIGDNKGVVFVFLLIAKIQDSLLYPIIKKLDIVQSTLFYGLVFFLVRLSD